MKKNKQHVQRQIELPYINQKALSVLTVAIEKEIFFLLDLHHW